MSCVKDGLKYLENKFGDDSISLLNVFKAVRLFSPKISSMHLSATDVDSLNCIPALNQAHTIVGLKEELPTYVARAEDVSAEVDELDWWKQNRLLLPNWSSAAAIALLIQPSSAAAESLFSTNASFSSRQYSSLRKIILMLQSCYNLTNETID